MLEFLRKNGWFYIAIGPALIVAGILIFSPPAFLVSWAIALAMTPAFTFFGTTGIALIMITFSTIAITISGVIGAGIGSLFDWVLNRHDRQDINPQNVLSREPTVENSAAVILNLTSFRSMSADVVAPPEPGCTYQTLFTTAAATSEVEIQVECHDVRGYSV